MPTARSVLRVLAVYVGSLCLLPVTFGSPAQLAGHWEGTMVREGASLQVSFDFNTSGSETKGTFTSRTQQAMDYPLNVFTTSADGVHFALGDSIVFDGKLVSDQIVGSFTDDGAGGKFTLHRNGPEASAPSVSVGCGGAPRVPWCPKASRRESWSGASCRTGT